MYKIVEKLAKKIKEKTEVVNFAAVRSSAKGRRRNQSMYIIRPVYKT